MTLEFRLRAEGQERLVGVVRDGDPVGSISNHRNGRRDIYLFDAAGRITKSRYGRDIEDPDHIDLTHVPELELLVTLEPGQAYEMPYATPNGIHGTLVFKRM